MKRIKEWVFPVMMLYPVVFSSCSKDIDDELSIMGSWTEKAPVEDRTDLFFISANRLSRTDGDGNTAVYSYLIDEDSLFLVPEQVDKLASSGTAFFIEQIDQNTLKIENIYSSTPEEEGEESFIIFERN